MFRPPSFPVPSGSAAPFTPSSGIKRRAPSPQLETPPYSSPVTEASTPNKKRRPNLANGFLGLSLSEHNETHAEPDEPDEDDLNGQRHHHRDIGVEVLPDTPSRSKRSGDRLWSHTGSTSSTSDHASEDEYDSDVTFRLPTKYGHVLQPDSVHLPESDVGVLDIEDLTELSNRKRRHRDTDSISQRTRKKQRDAMDVDTSDSLECQDGIEEITCTPERGRRRTHWHEPEKDRIIVTSLSSSPSSSRSSSRDSTSPRRHLTQPGEQGFTLSPSLLTHLLGTQKHAWNDLSPMPASEQKGLVLYRPLGIPPGTSMQWDEIVKNWKDRSMNAQDDSSRFEMVDDDEQLQSYGGEPIMPVINEYTDQDVPMDLG